MRPCARAAITALLFLSTALPFAGQAAEKPVPAELIRQYQADREAIDAAAKLPASSDYLARVAALDAQWQTRLQQIDFDALGTTAKVDYLVLATAVQKSLATTARGKRHLAEIDALVPFRATIQELEIARWHAAPLDCRSAASRIAAMTEQVKQVREKPDKNRGKTEPAVAVRAAGAVRELREALERWYEFYESYRPDFVWWMKRPYDEAGKQMDDYAKLLREEIAGLKGKDDDPLVGSPLGAEALAEDIRDEWLAYSADELIAIAERELAWCEGQMKVAAREMRLGDDWKAALAKVKSDYAPPGEQDELVAGIGREATEFVKGRNLVTVPPLAEQCWRVTMISPEGIKTIPYAAYGGQKIMVAYAASEMKQDDKLMVMRGNNRHFMRLVIPHELIPGHHLQAFYAARYNTQQLFTPFYAEGWAFYWELRLWDLNWARTPEDRIGMLFWRMTRCARVIVTLKYHLGRMKPAEMVTFLMDRVGHEKLGATSEVRRFIQAEPLYQVSYLIGGRQLYALHQETVAGGRMSEAQFHDAVLRRGSMPIELLRADLLDRPLRRDSKPTWRFDE